MKPKSSTEKSNSQSSDSFEAVAKRLECDDDKSWFEAKLGKLAKSSSKKGT